MGPMGDDIRMTLADGEVPFPRKLVPMPPVKRPRGAEDPEAWVCANCHEPCIRIGGRDGKPGAWAPTCMCVGKRVRPPIPGKSEAELMAMAHALKAQARIDAKDWRGERVTEAERHRARVQLKMAEHGMWFVPVEIEDGRPGWARTYAALAVGFLVIGFLAGWAGFEIRGTWGAPQTEEVLNAKGASDAREEKR